MIQDRNLHNPGHSPLTILKCFIECDYQTQKLPGQCRDPGSEIFRSGMTCRNLKPKSLPTNRACHEAYQAGERWQVLID